MLIALGWCADVFVWHRVREARITWMQMIVIVIWKNDIDDVWCWKVAELQFEFTIGVVTTTRCKSRRLDCALPT